MDDKERLEKLLYSVSHDLREPVRKIDAFTRLLMQEVEDPTPTMEKYAGYVIDGAARLRKMIEALLFLSRIGTREAGQQVLDGEAVGKAWRELAHPEGVRFDVGELPNVEGDPVLWQRLWHEVLENTIRFRDVARPLEVDVRSVAGDAPGFEVIDNGIGIPAPSESALEMFKSLHGRGEHGGVGAGLAVAAAIVEHHGGTLTVAPRQDGIIGTRVFFTWRSLSRR